MGHEWIKGLAIALLLSGLVFAVLPIQDWRRDTPRQESYDGLAEGLFQNWVFAFELLSLLLLAALIGALFLSQKPRRGTEAQP